MGPTSVTLKAFLLVLLLIPAQERNTIKKDLLAAVREGRSQDIKVQMDKFMKFDDGDTVRGLHSAYLAALKARREFLDQDEDIRKDLEKHEPVYSPNKHIIGGDLHKYNLALTKHKDVTQRLEALKTWIPRLLLAQQKLKSPAAVTAMADKLKKAGSWYARAQSALGLGAAGGEKAVAALLDCGRRERTPAALVGIIDALAPHGKENADVRQALVGHLKHKSWQVRSAAVVALEKAEGRDTVAALIAALEKADGRMEHELNRALVKITDVDKHGDFEAWTAWWKFNQKDFLAGTYKPHPSDKAARAGMSTFYGMPVTSDRILFLIDISQSMLYEASWRPPPESGKDFPLTTRRLDVAKFELQDLIRSLTDEVRFNIIFFDRHRRVLFDKLSTASPGKRKKALKFVEDISIGEGTALHDALLLAFDKAGGTDPRDALKSSGIDTIYLLTDGSATVGLVRPDIILERINEINRFKKVIVHTVAIDPHTRGHQLLKGLSGFSGGMFVAR
ncbi:MAG: VWA domain-containing protein [Planctomycetota bacterium]|jgi:hypothetical protein